MHYPSAEDPPGEIKILWGVLINGCNKQYYDLKTLACEMAHAQHIISAYHTKTANT